jgi:hypothetical protein
LITCALRVVAQGSFQNFNFESANPVLTGVPGGQVTFASAFPGWAGYLGNSVTSVGLFNDITLGSASIDLIGPGVSSSLGYGVMDGQYSTVLQAGGVSPGGSSVATSIGQSGTIPANDVSLELKAWVPGDGALSVSFNGYSLPLVALSFGVAPSGQSYTLYGANIEPYAGENGPLQFTANWGSVELDDISFSTTSIAPEPSIVALTVIGGLLCAARKWFARCGYKLRTG